MDYLPFDALATAMYQHCVADANVTVPVYDEPPATNVQSMPFAVFGDYAAEDARARGVNVWTARPLVRVYSAKPTGRELDDAMGELVNSLRETPLDLSAAGWGTVSPTCRTVRAGRVYDEDLGAVIREGIIEFEALCSQT